MREKLAIGNPEKKSTEQTWVVKGCKNHRPTLKNFLQIGPRGLNRVKLSSVKQPDPLRFASASSRSILSFSSLLIPPPILWFENETSEM